MIVLIGVFFKYCVIILVISMSILFNKVVNGRILV